MSVDSEQERFFRAVNRAADQVSTIWGWLALQFILAFIASMTGRLLFFVDRLIQGDPAQPYLAIGVGCFLFLCLSLNSLGKLAPSERPFGCLGTLFIVGFIGRVLVKTFL